MKSGKNIAGAESSVRLLVLPTVSVCDDLDEAPPAFFQHSLLDNID